ncbi:MAG: hypothetical protein NTV23_13520 [Propionibacteriales bacterium]|nr:hypothetical protein [Propionibacteriales bacterium]
MRDYVRCYRSHGVPQMPDPDELGSILIDRRKVRIDPQASRRADLACKGKAVPVPAEVKELLDRRNAASITPEQKQQFAEYSHCMQTHGAPDFPDPGSDGVGDEREWDQLSAGASRATSACAPIIGAPANPGPGVG